MYARSNTFNGNPAAMDEGIAYVRDRVLPDITGRDGCIGLSMLVDRESGRCIVTTAWESEEAMHASEPAVRDSRARAGEVLGGAAEVAEWEIAVMHRTRESGPDARVRVIWGGTDAGRMDATVDAFRTTQLSRLEELPGFCSCSLLVNTDTDRCVCAVTYADAGAMAEGGERAAAMRSESRSTIGLDITEVAEFDLALAHLRVPEMA